MKSYYKGESESDLGVGVGYVEVIDGWPIRQVEINGETWQWGDEANNESLGDQRLEGADLEGLLEISEEEFLSIWQEALRRCPRPS